MEIRMGSLLEGAREAQDTAIIIDVFRAFTTAAIAFSRGASRIVLVAEVAEALELRERGEGDLCMGEVSGIRPEGFDFGNSPFELSTADVGPTADIEGGSGGPDLLPVLPSSGFRASDQHHLLQKHLADR